METVATRLTDLGLELKRLHLERLRLMSEATRLTRTARPFMSVDDIADRLGLPPATVRGLVGLHD